MHGAGNLREYRETIPLIFFWGGEYACVDFNLRNQKTKIDCRETTRNNVS